MNLVAISRVKNEVDIIEAFVRHHCHYFGKLIIVDNASSDGTYKLLLALRDSGFPLALMREPTVGYDQSRHMSRLLQMAVKHFAADWIVPLDADEFVEPQVGMTLADVLRAQPAELLKVAWNNFAWIPEGDTPEPNPVVRMRLRMPPSPEHLDKVLIPAALATDGAVLTQGNHDLMLNGLRLPARRLDALALCHYPIRSVQQYAAKIAVGYLQYAATPDWDRLSGFHYIAPFQMLAHDADGFAQSAAAHSRRYSLPDDWPQKGDPQDAPLRYAGGPLQLASSPNPMLTNILICAESIASELAHISPRGEKAPLPHEVGHQGASDTDAAEHMVGTPSEAVDVIEPRHTFQSFWAGGALSPYESVCLKSFISHGHGVDLYSFDATVTVPTGVRLRNAAEVLSSDEFFVYEDGFGKGSPSGFANLFRYKLLAEKGGWWIDTDIICLSTNIPSFGEFVARQDADLINNAVLFFEPRHPIMVRCFEEARQLGRSVRWGETGPHLVTRLIDEVGMSSKALPSSTCYPVHHSDALDLLRPTRFRDLRQQTKSSLFVHLWNQRLVHEGIQKTLLPPRGSILRQWTDRHPVDGWTGEYDQPSLEHSLLLQSYCNRLTFENQQMANELKAQAQERASRQPLVQESERLQSELGDRLSETRDQIAYMQGQSAQMRQLDARILEQDARLEKQCAEIKNKDVELERQRADIQSILNSTSWRATAPLRAIVRRLSQFLKRDARTDQPRRPETTGQT